MKPIARYIPYPCRALCSDPGKVTTGVPTVNDSSVVFWPLKWTVSRSTSAHARRARNCGYGDMGTKRTRSRSAGDARRNGSSSALRWTRARLSREASCPGCSDNRQASGWRSPRPCSFAATSGKSRRRPRNAPIEGAFPPRADVDSWTRVYPRRKCKRPTLWGRAFCIGPWRLGFCLPPALSPSAGKAGHRHRSRNAKAQRDGWAFALKGPWR